MEPKTSSNAPASCCLPREALLCYPEVKGVAQSGGAPLELELLSHWWVMGITGWGQVMVTVLVDLSFFLSEGVILSLM